MSDSKTSNNHEQSHVLVLNLTDKNHFDDSEAIHWRFIHVNCLTSATKSLKDHNYKVAIAIIDKASLQRVIKIIKQLEKQQSPLLWIAITLDGEKAMKALDGPVTDYFLDYHHLPLDWQRLDHTLGHLLGLANINQQKKVQDTKNASPLYFGQSPQMQQLKSNLEKVALSDETLLIGGETGTGKGLCADYIHQLSSRKNGPFITVNCGALPASLIHSELFGHEKGAFTGADKQYIGHIERANKGTLFLDEIGDLPLELQINLLHFLEEHYIERLGATKTTNVDCRVIFATHVDLESSVEEGHFREDLYYRINTLQIDVPSLRQHKVDICILAKSYLEKLAPETRQFHFSKASLLALEQYQWPGNIRELKNRIQRAIVMSDSGEITPEDLGLKTVIAPAPEVVDLAQHRTEIDTELLLNAIKHNNHNISAAARELNISRTTFYRLIKKCKITL
ncbi:sigma-54 dependent transcriptional regulator [Shewanella sp. AS1]|uniref:sigma-54 dependent transcriptional regulator n=1 Tax=Shewanella sp. AS1 TaxID=2907626 RepID=UPI001F2DC4A6|nr:sigma-54 dependent transcriptional regulator [Shewanella sp. AS1]MCE9678999.1 sigma-54 dependent transcriptional regulator [Shewanella sp. AS1]